MKSLYDFIVEPLGERYANTKKIGEKTLILNTKIESWKFVNRFAVVLETPIAIKTSIKKGDIVIVHQNVFRRFYNMKGKQSNSRSYFKDNMYFVQLDQVYLYKPKNKWLALGDRCFLAPIKDLNEVDTGLEQRLIGIVKYGNSSLEALGINEGDLVGFRANREWEFIVGDQRLYCMKSNDIIIEYEYQGNEKEYNPSWARSC